jgi:hypothetical protein
MRSSYRVSIAGLMIAVLAASLAFAALRSGSALWTGCLHLLTRGAFILAIVGAACRRGSERAWWLDEIRQENFVRGIS